LRPRHQRGDQVGDRLALARAGRAVDHQALAPHDHVDGAALGGVRVQNRVVVRGRDVVEHGVRLAAGGDRRLGVRVARDGGDHIAVGQQVSGAAQIPDHRQLGVGEGADHLPVSDVEARYLRRRCHLPQP
jgi:hypothetical protein